MAAALDSKPSVFGREGSTPSGATESIMAYIPPWNVRILTVDDSRTITVKIKNEIIVAFPADDVAKFMPAVTIGDSVLVTYTFSGEQALWKLP